MPEGLSLSPEGLISGTPLEFGLFPFTVRVSEPYLCDQFFERSLYVVCEVVSQFPWEEGFEEGRIPSCWTQEYVVDSVDWRFVSGLENPAAPVTEAYEGNCNALFKAETYDGWATKLVSPQLDLSSLQNPCLSFAYAQPVWITDQDQLKVYVKNAATADWTELLSFEGDIPQWRDTTVALPDPSAEYFVAFEGISRFGYGAVVDAVRVAEGDVANEQAEETAASVIRYNNPVDRQLRLQWGKPLYNQLGLYDAMGREVFRMPLGKGECEAEILMEDWENGLYMLVLSGPRQATSLKIIKQ